MVNTQLISFLTFSPQASFFTSLMIFSPQIKKYLTLYYQKHTKKENQKQNLKNIVLLPLIFIICGSVYMLPNMTYELPFVKQTKPVWIYNSFSTTSIIILNHIPYTYIAVIITLACRFDIELNTQFIQGEKAKDFITNPDKWFIYVYVLIMGLYFVNMVIKLTILIGKYRCFKAQKSKNQKKHTRNEQDKVLKIQEQEISLRNLDVKLQNEENFDAVFESKYISERSQVLSPSHINKYNASKKSKRKLDLEEYQHTDKSEYVVNTTRNLNYNSTSSHQQIQSEYEENFIENGEIQISNIRSLSYKQQNYNIENLYNIL